MALPQRLGSRAEGRGSSLTSVAVSTPRRSRLRGILLLGACIAALIELAPYLLEMARRSREIARLTAAPMPASLPSPVVGIVPARLTDSWGARRSGGRSHQGIDIFAPRGRPVISTTHGMVVTVGYNSLGGRIVRVLGPGSYWHYYAHLDRFASISAGDLVRPGTVLGYVGDSGNAKGTPPHLHYGIYRPRGGAVNPYPYLARAGEN